MEGSSATILCPGRPALLGRYDAAGGTLDPYAGKPSRKQVERALAHVMLPSLLYREQRYRLPP